MKTIGEIIARNESFYPEVEAYVQDMRRLTHRGYGVRIRCLATAFARHGIQPQSRIAILSMNSIEYCELLGACEWAGFIAVTVNFRLTEGEIDYVLQDSAPQALVFESQYAETVDRLRQKHPDLGLYVCVGDAPSWAIPYEVFAASHLARAGSPHDALPSSTEDDYVTLIYTSGTTGRPKGVVSTQRRITQMAVMMAGEHDMGVNGRTLIVTPLFHIGGQNMRLAQASRSGTLVIIRTFDATDVLRTVERERIEVIFMVATQLQLLLDCPELDQFDLTSLKTLNVSGAPIPTVLLRRGLDKFGKIFIVQYGMTEGMCTTLYRSQINPEGTPEEIARIGSVGHVMPGGHLRVVGADGRDCAPGEPGEVWIRSQTMLEAYWNNHTATIDALRFGWLHTGDIGYLDQDDFLYLVDRKKDMIISGGENIYCREIEETLSQHPDVAEAAVIGIPDDKWGEAVKAYVVPGNGATSCADDALEARLIEHCRAHLSRYKCPKSIEFIREMPRLPTGKISKVRLREMHRALA